MPVATNSQFFLNLKKNIITKKKHNNLYKYFIRDFSY